MTKTLFLHIGYFKTGSSYLQEMWRLNHGILEEQGLVYPIPERIREGGFGRITSGNGGVSLNGGSQLGETLDKVPTEKSCLLSSEHFFTQICERKDISYISRVPKEQGFQRIKVLLLVRDPIGLMSSLYDQELKRAEGAMTIKEFYRDPGIMVTPAKTSRVIEKLEGLEGVELTVMNYSFHRRELLAPVSSWLGIDPAGFEVPEVQTVNRSLSAGERELLRQLNQRGARKPIDLANALCEKAPLVKSDQIIPPEEVQQKFLDSHKDDFKVIQDRLPEGEALSLAHLEPSESKKFDFTGEQLSELVEYLVRYQKKEGFLESKIASFRNRFGI